MLRTTLTLLLLTTAPIAQPGEDWPHWRGPGGNGIAPESGWATAGAEKPLWRAEVGRGYSSPSIADGLLFTRGFFARENEKQGVDATVCLDVRTGDEIWRHESPAELFDNMHAGGTLTTPTVAAGFVYVLSRFGMLWALDAETGSVRWEQNLGETLAVEAGFFGLSSSPAFHRGELFLNVGKTLSLDPLTGELRWSSEDYGYSYGTPVPFDLDERALLAVFNAKGLAVLDRSSGAEIALHPWTSEYNVNSATPIIIEDQIFISTGYNEKGCALLRLSDDSLEVVWENRSMNNQMNGCVLLGEHLYGFDTTKLRCLDLEGNTAWTVRGLGRGTVIASDDRLIVLSEEGTLQIGAASPAGFEPEYERSVLASGPCWTTPVLSNGRIFCRNASGTLVALDHRPAE